MSIATELKRICILVPAYNEQEVLPEFYSRVCAVVDKIERYV